MSLLGTIAIIFFLVVIMPMAASFLMAIFLESANNEGLYDDED